MQVGGILVSNRVDEVPENVFVESGRINSTWGASLVDMVRSTHILDIIQREGLLDNAAARGQQLLDGLQDLTAKYDGWMTNARGQGLLCAVDLPSREVREAVIDQCFEGGMIVLPCGERSVRFRPALNVTEEDVAEGLRRLDAAIRATSERLAATDGRP